MFRCAVIASEPSSGFGNGGFQCIQSRISALMKEDIFVESTKEMLEGMKADGWEEGTNDYHAAFAHWKEGQQESFLHRLVDIGNRI